MFKRMQWKAIGICLGLIIAQSVPAAIARDEFVYNNLLKSRDALLSQRAYLQKAIDDLGGQINDLQDKKNRVADYETQVDKALRDVDLALRQAQ